MPPRTLLRVALLCGALAWSLPLLAGAWQRLLWAWRCARICPPFVPVEHAVAHVRALDWQTPLLLAALPLTAWGAWCLLRAAFRR